MVICTKSRILSYDEPIKESPSSRGTFVELTKDKLIIIYN